ncbi:MAG: 3-hydroxyisobutyryl-CoA hydrolase [Cellvibrionales bacterium TMED49]|nr:3-hydroxyisobutyryl-CoA hydrolase [Porticoccaceae bacterium]OUU39001.1 MAG: 3-hydroxyisobutyryl-CoA hydrolase [Cellvibrionales bacterium TMED49]
MEYIKAEINSGVGCITLNRPTTLNALTLDMICQLTNLLIDWRDNSEVEAVAIRGCNKAGPFGDFCAGGDIRFFYLASTKKDKSLSDFFTAEYRLTHLIYNYPKPYIAFMDGVVMGGGMGLSQGASFRVVTERTRMAMPETNIGFFPDVGASFFLNRCDNNIGKYIGITGQVLSGNDAVAVGLADGVLMSSELHDNWDLLTNSRLTKVSDRINKLQIHCMNLKDNIHTPSWFDPHLILTFGQETLGKALERLVESDGEWAKKTLQKLKERSPIMLYITFKQLIYGQSLTLAECLRMERDLAQHCFYPTHPTRVGMSNETIEGIRALVIDKDFSPSWNPKNLDDVTSEMIEPFFKSPWLPSEHPLADLK